MDTFGKGNGHAPRTVPRPSYPPPTRLASSPKPRSTPPATMPSPPPLPGRRSEDFGIQRAVDLLRRLPPGEREKFVEVVKMTLESVNVRVESIIDDAKRRNSEIEDRIAVLQQEVTDREQEIAARREEIMNLEIEHSEISGVQQQLSPSETAPESAPVLIEEASAANDERPTGEIDLEATLAAIEFK